MVWLVLETLVLMAVFTFAGIPVGIALRRVLSRGPALVAAGVPAGTLAGEGDDADFAPLDPAPTARIETRREAEPIVPEAEPEPELVIDAGRAAVADQIGVRPAMLAGPRDGRPDDLKLIKGIGPQNEARLNTLGIHHFDQIAAWTPEEARWIGSYLAFPGRIEREDWVNQAKGLAGRG